MIGKERIAVFMSNERLRAIYPSRWIAIERTYGEVMMHMRPSNTRRGGLDSRVIGMRGCRLEGAGGAALDGVCWGCVSWKRCEGRAPRRVPEMREVDLVSIGNKKGHLKKDCPTLRRNGQDGNNRGATQKYVEKGCELLFLAQVTEQESKEKRLEDVPVVRDFPEVFPEDLPGLPPPRRDPRLRLVKVCFGDTLQKSLGKILDMIALAYHPENDGQSERTIQTLEKTVDSACVMTMDFIKNRSVAYVKLGITQELQGIHNTFHVSNLKKCLSDEDLVIPFDEIRIDEKLHFIEEPIEIVDKRRNNSSMVESR
ncbi:hypothetical protein Tco_1193995 [Tanacetum coccineum]